jgi:hypothetical protein
MDKGHWVFDKDFDIDEWVGFVYRITNITNGKQYIGKKFFHSTLRKKVVGRTNRKKVVTESNWKKYCSSSKWLQADIEEFGKDNFRFEIMSLHESKSSLGYEEVRMLVLAGAMYADANFYNGMLPPIKCKPKQLTAKEREYRI